MLFLIEEDQEGLFGHGGFEVVVEVDELDSWVPLEDLFELIAAAGYFEVLVNFLTCEDGVHVGKLPFLFEQKLHDIFIELLEVPGDVIWYFDDIWSFAAPDDIIFDIFHDRFFEYFAKEGGVLAHNSVVVDIVVKKIVEEMGISWSCQTLEDYW